jgi:hypothetical protein
MAIASDILNYGDRIEDRDYLVTIVTSNPVEELSAVICDLQNMNI